MNRVNAKTIALKTLPVVLNIEIVLGAAILFAPFQPIPTKIFIILLFLIYSLAAVYLNRGRDVGMAMLNLDWAENYPNSQLIVYAVLNTLSFSTIFFYVFFPFDLFLVNIFLIQLPTLIKKGNTFQSYMVAMDVVLRGPIFKRVFSI